MRSDLQALLNLPQGASGSLVSKGQLPGDKQLVLTFLYLRWLAGNTTLTPVNAVNKAAGLQGVTPDNMVDFQIQGLATFQGFGGFGWTALVNAARTAINGQGQLSGGLNKSLTTDDYNDLINYSLLTGTHVLNDAS